MRTGRSRKRHVLFQTSRQPGAYPVHALQRLQNLFDDGETSPLARLLDERAGELLAAHRRVRQEVGERVRGLTVHPNWPPDVLALLVLQPLVQG